jgi:hypothetical protein
MQEIDHARIAQVAFDDPHHGWLLPDHATAGNAPLSEWGLEHLPIFSPKRAHRGRDLPSISHDQCLLITDYSNASRIGLVR